MQAEMPYRDSKYSNLIWLVPGQSLLENAIVATIMGQLLQERFLIN